MGEREIAQIIFKFIFAAQWSLRLIAQKAVFSRNANKTLRKSYAKVLRMETLIQMVVLITYNDIGHVQNVNTYLQNTAYILGWASLKKRNGFFSVH